MIATLNTQLSAREGDLSAAQARITSFEQQVASLLADRDAAKGQMAQLGQQVSDLTTARDTLQTEQDALQLAVAKARSEIDAQAEAARLAAARRAALDALIADLHTRVSDSQTALADVLKALDANKAATADLGQQVTALQSNLSEAEKARLAKALATSEKERDSLAKRLDNPAFVEKAKPEAIDKARADHAAHAAEAERLASALARLG